MPTATMPRIPPPPPPGGNKPLQQPRLQAPPPPSTPGRAAPPPPPARNAASPDSKRGRGVGRGRERETERLKACKHCISLSCHLLSLFSDDLENRFQFNMDLPPPDMWKAGPKTYPSQNTQNRTRTGGGGSGGMSVHLKILFNRRILLKFCDGGGSLCQTLFILSVCNDRSLLGMLTYICDLP